MTPDTLAAAAGDPRSAAGRGRRRRRRRAGRSAAPRSCAQAALRAIEADLRRYLEHEARTAGGAGARGLELRFGFEGEDGLAAGARARRGRRPRPRARPGRPRRRRRRRARRRARLQVRRPAPGLVGGALERGPPAPGRALHAGRARAHRAPSRSPASISRCAARTCAPAACSSRGRRRLLAWWPPTAGPPRSSTRCSPTPRERAVALAAPLRAGELEPCPQNCSRDGCTYPAICRSQ